MTLEAQLEQHRELLWGLCYRMTGCAADADDLVQETFKKALERPPRLDSPLRPWLTQVTVNLARDALRRRKRSPYQGEWLPELIETSEETFAVEPASTEGRYDLLESVSIAFLLALEALSSKQRAVLLLRDVFDYPVREVAQALDVSEDDVKTSHLRARRAMEAYEPHRHPPTRTLRARHQQTLNQLVEALLAADVAQLEALLTEQVKHSADGAGQYTAARVPIFGPKRVAAFLMRILKLRGPPARVEVKWLNGFPTLVTEFDGPLASHDAPRSALSIDIDDEGRIRTIYNVVADAKLRGVKALARD